MRKNVLNFDSRVIDTHTPRVDLAIQDKNFKSRGFLNILKSAWSLRPEEGMLNEAISLFDNWTGDRGDLLLSLGNYTYLV